MLNLQGYFTFNLANLTQNVKYTYMYERFISNSLESGLSHSPAVAILGPRQVGKTTLARSLSRDISTHYLDLERASDLSKLSDPVEYLSHYSDSLVILDEVHHAPDLFMSLRSLIDSDLPSIRRNGRFLILGSASGDLLRQSSESLAGRIRYCELSGFNILESGGSIRDLWLRGGFPNSYMSDDIVSYSWRHDFILTYLQRDIPQFGVRIPSETLMRFWTMLAHSQGDLLNASKLGASLGITNMTVTRYLDLLSELFLVRYLRPLHRNTKKRLVRSPRVYIRDSGIVHSLLQIPDYESLLSHSVLGKSWEGFIIENILSILPPSVIPSFYRTAAGSEIDLVLEFAPDTFWAIEIKANTTPKLTRGFHTACADIAAEKKYVIYSGSDEYPIGNETTVLSLPHFMQRLNERIGTNERL